MKKCCLDVEEDGQGEQESAGQSPVSVHVVGVQLTFRIQSSTAGYMCHGTEFGKMSVPSWGQEGREGSEQAG